MFIYDQWIWPYFMITTLVEKHIQLQQKVVGVQKIPRHNGVSTLQSFKPNNCPRDCRYWVEFL